MLDITPRPGSKARPAPRPAFAPPAAITAVLVHGPWSDPSCSARVIPLLRGEGLGVLAILAMR